MNSNVLFLWPLYFSIVLVSGLLYGKWMANLMSEESPRFEDKLLRYLGIDTTTSMNWKDYLLSVLMFSFVGFIFLQIILMSQQWLPLNPDHKPNVPFLMAFNITASFVTNTNWQNYGGESTLSHFAQMAGLTVQNFLSAAVGVAVLVALIRGLIKHDTNKLGNFWSDVTRFTLRILLPLSFVFALFLVHQGVPQTFQANVPTKTLEGANIQIPLGPVASQIAIKMNGSNGGGFYNANGAHPYENPTPLTNFVHLISILLLPIACVFMFIFMLPNHRQGYMILVVMGIMLGVGILFSYWGEIQINPITKMHFLEGTETRISLSECSLWSTLTTAVSNGSVNCLHSSLSPVAQLIALFNMMTGEVIFGGVGSGLYGMLLYVLLTVFMAGLMVGRTPEYLGKKIETKEVIWVGVALLSPGLMNLLFSALALNLNAPLSSLAHVGSHGLSEVIYAFSSALGNNGSAFAGLNANTIFFNLTTGIGMLLGRFVVIVASLYIAGSMGIKKVAVTGPGTLRTDTSIFAFLLWSVIIVVGALTFFPVLALGPIAEYLLMNNF